MLHTSLAQQCIGRASYRHIEIQPGNKIYSLLNWNDLLPCEHQFQKSNCDKTKMDAFIYTSSPSRVIFGQGKVATLPQEVERLGVSRCLVLCTRPQTVDAKKLTDLLGDKAVGVFDNATMHTPIEITEEAIKYATEQKADSVVSIGGGSTIGLGKAISIRTGISHICIPTTYAGSEMTPILGETVDGRKITRTHPDIKPDVVIYDVDLTMTLPVGLSLTSSINAIAHAGKFLLSYLWGRGLALRCY